MDKVSGWDPYNVTEDADLGIRLARFGYQTGVLALPTFEDGPENWKEWMPQRIRWQKGWMQTGLVHSRSMSGFFSSIGFRDAIYSIFIMAGFVLAPLLYPLGIATFFLAMSRGGTDYDWLAMLDVMLFSFGFIAYALLGFACDPAMRQMTKIGVLISLPFYWLITSIAAWRALVELVLNPFYWNKTPHRPTRNPAMHAASMNS